LGEICNNSHGIAIAGTHGKTSITTCVAHIMYNSNEGCSAFLGGISKNFKSNFIHSPHSTNVVVEADEFDRSFHNLHPHIALVSSVDADHLDIYGNYENIVSAFHTFVGQIQEGGTFIYKYGLDYKTKRFRHTPTTFPMRRLIFMLTKSPNKTIPTSFL
jgi:UDP-N-acetylmuramate--alanine ligase